MTNPIAVIPDAEAENRWRKWQARGADNDRRLATKMRRVLMLVATGLVAWLYVQLA
jgi:hypothetical protein